jgi:hypothetical protein
VHRDVPYVALWWVDNVVVKNKHLHGFTPTPSGELRWLAQARWVRDAPGPVWAPDAAPRCGWPSRFRP